MTEKSTRLHALALKCSLILYVIACVTSMAGMEIFGWLTFTLTVAYVIRTRGHKSIVPQVSYETLSPYLPWKVLIGLMIVTILGIFVNGQPDADKLFVIGSQRWMFLLATNALALTLFPPSEKAFRAFVVLTSAIGIYGVIQFFTGVDLFRPITHERHPILESTAVHQLYRTSGTFGSPLSYVYIAGMYFCFPFAALILYARASKSDANRRMMIFGAAGTVFIGASVFTSFTRGGWIAVAAAVLVMAALVSRRALKITLVASCVTIIIAFVASSAVRQRLLSIFDMNYSSNYDRLYLWKANWAMFLDYPLLGVGYGENESRAGEYLAKIGLPDAFRGHAHNNLIQMLSGTGVFGFALWIFFAAFFFWLSYRLWKSLPDDAVWTRTLALGCLGAQVVLHIGGLTECNFKDGETSHAFMMVLGIIASQAAIQFSLKPVKRKITT